MDHKDSGVNENGNGEAGEEEEKSVENVERQCSKDRKIENGNSGRAGAAISTTSEDTQNNQATSNQELRSVVSKSSVSSIDNEPQMPTDDDDETTRYSNETQLNDRRYKDHNRRPSLGERRNFRAPLSAPYDQKTFGSGERSSGTRKTSLPTIMRPTDLELTPGGARGSGGSSRRIRSRLSESTNFPLKDDRTKGSKMSKSKSDNPLGIPSPSQWGASYNPDDVEGSEDQLRDTAMVVQTFMTAAYQRELEHQMVAIDTNVDSPQAAEASVMTGIISTPDLPLEMQMAPLSPTAEVGRRLALMADEFDQRYRTDLDEMARLVLPYILGRAGISNGWSLTFDVFRNVARKLFEGAQITWGRIVALLSFGYRLTVAVLNAGLPDFVRKIVNLVSEFIIVEPIANWIYRQGGWIKALLFQPTADNPRLQAMVEIGYWSVQLFAAVVLTWSWLTKR